MSKNILDVILETLKSQAIKPTRASVTYFYLKSLQETVSRISNKKGTMLVEGADMDPEQVQKALEDAAGQLSTLQDFLNPDNMKRFEAAAEFIPQLDEFFGSLNTHFEIQKQKEEEAAEEAEAAAAEAEAKAEAEAEEQAAEAEEEAEAEAEEAEEESAEAEENDAPPPNDAPPAEQAQAEPDEEGGEEELNESVVNRWKTLAKIRG